VRRKGERAEQSDDCPIAHIETARIGAERRHDEPLTIGRETTPADGAATLRDTRHRMQVAGNLAILGLLGRLMPKSQPSDRQNVGETATHIPRQVRIVIAGDPNPIAAALQSLELDAVKECLLVRGKVLCALPISLPYCRDLLDAGRGGD
jgi:hypothetical protein